MSRIFWLGLVLAACKDGKGGDSEGGGDDGTTDDSSTADDSATDDSGTDDSGTETCGGTAPTLAEPLTIVNNSSEKDGVILKLSGVANDPDGDLHALTLNVWWDTKVDKTVDVTVPADSYYTGTAIDNETGKAAAPCSVNDLNWGYNLTIDGTAIPFNTEFEFAMTIQDAAGMSSNAIMASARTPNKDGSDGKGTPTK